MTNFFSLPSSLTRPLWVVGMLLITAAAAQAQVLSFTITGISPTNASGPVGTTVTLTGSSNLIATTTTVTFNGQGSPATPGTVTTAPTVTNLVNSTVTFDVPATLAAGLYNISVQTIAAGLVTDGSSNAISFTVTAQPLPVQLTSFTAETIGNGARLRWATASEKDNDHFDVEASTDGRAFARVGQVAGHGSTALPQQYTFTDENLARYATALVYYRLRQVDGDGTSTFSQIRTVAVATGGKPVLVLYPTVATDGQATNYTYAGPELATGATLEIYSLTGQRVLTQPVIGQTGTLTSQALAAGWYWVRLAGTAPVRFYHQ